MINKEQVIEYLKKNEFGYYGIASTGEDKDESSIEPVAIVSLVLSRLGALNKSEVANYTKRILSTKGRNGAFFTINNIYGVWSTSQACLALSELGCDISVFEDSLKWLCDKQDKTGGWSYDGVFSKTSIIHAFYTIIVLNKYKDTNETYEFALAKSITYLINVRDSTNEKNTSRLIALYLLRVLGISSEEDVIENICNQYFGDVITNKKDDVFVDVDNKKHFNYFIGFYYPASYLLLRLFFLPDHPFMLFLISRLQNSIIDGKCWQPNKTDDSPTSWATALSLYTLERWEYDCQNNNIAISMPVEVDLIKAVEQYIRRKRMLSNPLKVCPLNEGECNKVNEIRNAYNNKNVFLDIPYDDEYEDYEIQIKKTLKKKDLNPVVAKDESKSSIVLCKVCQRIQICKYGIADFTNSKANVYFELGMLYGTNRKCAILKKVGTIIPADLSGIEYIEYANTRELGEKLTNWLNDNVKK